MSMFDYPQVNYPTTLLGYISGKDLRYESLTDSEIILSGNSFIKDEMPFACNKNIYALSPLQKRSHFGFLLQWPLCLHLWFFPRLQKDNGQPGTEFGKYFRIGLWRWDVAGTDGKHWIKFPASIYVNFSTHWD